MCLSKPRSSRAPEPGLRSELLRLESEQLTIAKRWVSKGSQATTIQVLFVILCEILFLLGCIHGLHAWSLVALIVVMFNPITIRWWRLKNERLQDETSAAQEELLGTYSAISMLREQLAEVAHVPDGAVSIASGIPMPDAGRGISIVERLSGDEEEEGEETQRVDA